MAQTRTRRLRNVRKSGQNRIYHRWGVCGRAPSTSHTPPNKIHFAFKREVVSIENLESTAVTNTAENTTESTVGTVRVKRGMAEQLKGGVIMDVVTPEQAKIAEDAGAVAVMALERVPADIRKDGGVARMSDPEMIEGIINAVSIPVMAKVRIGHFVEAQVLQALEVDFIDESEVLTPADETNHINKWDFTVPFVCGATNLGEALRRIAEGAALIRSKGEAGTGNVVEAVRHMRQITSEIRRLTQLDDAELFAAAKELRAPYELVREVAREGKLPVPCSPPEASLPPQTPPSCASSARRASSSARASSSPGTRPSEPRPSWKPPPPTTTRTPSLGSPAASGKPWSGSTSTNWTLPSATRAAAGSLS